MIVKDEMDNTNQPGSLLAQTLEHPDRKPDLAALSTGATSPSVEVVGPGIVRFEPRNPQGQAIISAGIHGNETAPIEMVDRLVSDILGERLNLQARLLVILGNPRAMVARTRFLDQNLNRLFGPDASPSSPIAHSPTGHQPDYETVRSRELLAAIEDFVDVGPSAIPPLHYELHTAIRGSRFEKFAVVPDTGRSPRVSGEDLDRFHRAGIEALLLANGHSTTFSWYTANRFGGHSATLELGAVRPFGENDLSKLTPARKVIDSILTGVGLSVIDLPSTPPPRLFRVVTEVLRHYDDGFEFHLADDVPNFTSLPPRFRLTTDPDGGYTTPDHPVRVVFPNPLVAVGQRCAVLVEETTSGTEDAATRR